MKNIIVRPKLIFISMLLLLNLRAYTQDVRLVVVANGESIPPEMSMSELRQVLRGEKLRWADGKGIKIALMKTNTPVGSATCQRIYKMSAHELNKYFLALVFQGKVKAPTFFNSEEELKLFVEQNPGAIGVLQNLSDNQLKTISVDGGEAL